MKNNRAVKACIFDLDGTLLDTLTSLWYCASLSLKKEGLKELPRDNFRYYVGDGALTQVERYLKDTEIVGKADETGIISKDGIPNPHDRENLKYYFESYMRELDRNADYEVKPYPGIPETLKVMKNSGIKLAVFSNKPDSATQKIIPEYFGDMFDTVLGKKDENPKKPNPKGALMIADGFGIAPSEIMYIGDTGTDMQTGKNAGMFTVGVLWGFRDKDELTEYGADAVAGSPEELLNYVNINA